MIIQENERRKILEYAKFLDDMGYKRTVEEHAVIYSGNGIDFMVGFEPYSDTGDVDIRFVRENEVFSVGWIACVRSGLHFSLDPKERLDCVLKLLQYIREHYHEITQIRYCRESDQLIDAFLARKKQTF